MAQILEDIQILFELSANKIIQNSNTSKHIKSKANLLAKDFLKKQRSNPITDISKIIPNPSPQVKLVGKATTRSKFQARKHNREQFKTNLSQVLK